MAMAQDPSIYVDDESLFNELKDYVKTIAPEKEDIVKFYQGKVSLFESRGINKQIKATFGRKVNLKSLDLTGSVFSFL